jgi:integrase
MTASAASRRSAVISSTGRRAEAGYLSDYWHADVLRVPARRGGKVADFRPITQPWLRETVKRWSRMRLATGCTFSTVSAQALAMARFSRFLAECHPDVADERGLTRGVLEDYLSWLLELGYSKATRAVSLSMLRVFLEACRRHGWLPRLPANADVYVEELPRGRDQLPRFIPEFVMSQLESEQSLARLQPRTLRNLVIVLMETGLRRGDACTLPFNPLVDDSVGWPCLRFPNEKMRADQLIPLSTKAAAAIRDQQDHVRTHWPNGSPWLFPGLVANPDGVKPYASGTLVGQLRRWQAAIDLRDEAGVPVRVTPHRFRHTVGTRLINSGVPQHIVQKLLGHASPRMTAHYAHLHDRTIREAFERYQQLRVNTAGEILPYDPEAPTASAEWVKHNVSRVRDSLPNGYCGRPPQQDCPHPNACLTCPDFQTTPEFLDVHRRQAATNRRLIARADADGRFRLAANLRQVQASLERIIPALEAIADREADDGAE